MNKSKFECGHAYGWAYLNITDCNATGKELKVTGISYLNDFPYDFMTKLGLAIINQYEYGTPIDFSYEIDCEGYSKIFILTPYCAYMLTHLDNVHANYIEVDDELMFRLFFYLYEHAHDWVDFAPGCKELPLDLMTETKVYNRVKEIFEKEF